MGKLTLGFPLNERHVNSEFGKLRFHPIKKQWLPHNGTDYKAALQDPVYAAEKGVVVRAARSETWGNLIIIDHAPNASKEMPHMYTLYGHLGYDQVDIDNAKKKKETVFSATPIPSYLVKKGDEVNKGDIIGLAGSSGGSTGPHLHFAVVVSRKGIEWPAIGTTGLLDGYTDKEDKGELGKYLNPDQHYATVFDFIGTLDEMELSCEELVGLQEMMRYELEIGVRPVGGLAIGGGGKPGRVIVTIPTLQEFLESIGKGGYEVKPPKLKLELTNAFTAVESAWLGAFIVEVNGKNHGLMMPGTRTYELDWKSLH